MGSPILRIARLAAYLSLTCLLMPVQAAGLVLHRSWVVRLPLFYHRLCCRILGFAVRSVGSPCHGTPTLFVANHVSYIDITVLGSLIGGSFVAKNEVAQWPLFGWLAKLQRSVFIDRQVRSAAAHHAAISARLARGDRLILFPEGTSGDGNRILPFKTALFGVAQSCAAAGEVIVQPVSLAYTRLDGIPLGRAYRPLFAWYGGMTLAPHLWEMIGLGTIEVVVEFHPPTTLRACGSRKALAEYCRARIEGGVGAALSGRAQPVPEPPEETVAAAAE